MLFPQSLKPAAVAASRHYRVSSKSIQSLPKVHRKLAKSLLPDIWSWPWPGMDALDQDASAQQNPQMRVIMKPTRSSYPGRRQAAGSQSASGDRLHYWPPKTDYDAGRPQLAKISILVKDNLITVPQLQRQRMRPADTSSVA